MKAKQLFSFIIIGVFSLLQLNAQELLEGDKKYFKYGTYNDNIGCLHPYTISEIDRVYIKDDQGLLYVIEIAGSEGNCSYNTERIVFRKNTPQDVVDRVLSVFEPKIHMQLSFQVMFNVKKMAKDAGERVVNKSITIPYFVIINNRETEEILYTQDLSINIVLNDNNLTSYNGRLVNIKQDFLITDFANMEVLTGIYFNNYK